MKFQIVLMKVVLFLVVVIFQYKACAQKSVENNFAVIYEKGVASGDQSVDSLKYFADLLNQSQSNSPFKNYYHHALNFLYYYKTGGVDQLRISAFETLKWSKQTGDQGLISDAYSNVALYYKDVNAPDSTTHYFKLSLSAAMDIEDANRFHQVSINYSNLLIKQGRKEEALDYVYQSIAYDSLQNANANQGHNYHLLGNIHLYSGDYPSALNAYLISLEAFKKNGNITKRINVTNNIGLVYTSIGNYELAEETYLNLIEFIDANGLQREKVSALINLGSVHSNQGDQATNRKLLLEALEISERYNFMRFQSQIQNNLGNAAYYEGDYNSALDYFQQGYETNIRTHNKQEATLSQTNIGWAYLMLGNQQACFDSFKKALSMSYEVKSAEKRMMALEGLADASEYFGNYKDALFYKNQFVALKDSILGEKSRTKLAELQTLYETEKKTRQIEDLKQEKAFNTLTISENELKISQLNWQRFGLGLLILLILFITLIGWRLLRNKKENEKNQALLREREKGIQAVFDATEEERQRIAKDLHDGVGQQMSGLKLAWQNLTISSKNLTEEEKNKLHELSKILDSTAADVRDISHRMMPKVLEAFGLVPAIDEMLEKSFKLSDINYEFEHYNFDQRLPKKTEIALFRICQELINNVIKHANANFVSIQLFKNQNQLILIVEDNGKGIADNANQDGHGLLNIKSRLNTINGQVNYEGSTNAGTTATIRILLS